MTSIARGPFDNIESAHEYVGLMCEALDEARELILEEIEMPSPSTVSRHLDALRLVDYKLTVLRQHFSACRRLLTDLRTLRRLLLAERPGAANTLVRARREP